MEKDFVDNFGSQLSGRLLEIIEYKVQELESLKSQVSLEKLKEDLAQLESDVVIRDFESALIPPLAGLGRSFKSDEVALIAEVKKASPSVGDINLDIDIIEQAKQYEIGGADAISVLTDKKFFKGDIEFLKQIKQTVSIPVLRKDFIFDSYQVYESKLYGADAILLIATILTLEKLQELISLSRELGLECLVEAHTKSDIEKILNTDAKIIGVNARDLKTFDIDLQNIIDLAPLIPKDKVFIAESGVETADDVRLLQKAGARGVLVGTTLMKASDVKQKIKELKLV